MTELARRAGVNLSHVSRIESGEIAHPSGTVLRRLADALGTSVDDLLELPVAASPPAVPESLRRFGEREGLPPEDVAMLAAVRYRGEQPRTTGGWAFLYEAIRRSVLEVPERP